MKRIPNCVRAKERARLEEERRCQEAHSHSRTSCTFRDWSPQEGILLLIFILILKVILYFLARISGITIQGALRIEIDQSRGGV